MSMKVVDERTAKRCLGERELVRLPDENRQVRLQNLNNIPHIDDAFAVFLKDSPFADRNAFRINTTMNLSWNTASSLVTMTNTFNSSQDATQGIFSNIEQLHC
jgi:hypothetical protein